MSYRRFGTTYRYFQGPIVCPETTVTKYQSKLCNILVEGRSYLHSRANLKSRNVSLIKNEKKFSTSSNYYEIPRPRDRYFEQNQSQHRRESEPVIKMV